MPSNEHFDPAVIPVLAVSWPLEGYEPPALETVLGGEFELEPQFAEDAPMLVDLQGR